MDVKPPITVNRRTFIGGSIAAGMGRARPSTRFRVAIFGSTGRGDYGHDLDTVWLDLPEAEIVAVADDSAEGRERAKTRLKAPSAYADYRELLRREKPAVVSIAPRWVDQHRDMLLACAESGVRGVLIEKPLGRDLVEADQMVAACEKSRLKVAIAYQTRYSPRVDAAKRLIAEGRLGDILELRARGKEDARGGGEDLAVLGTHLFDLMRYFAGNPRWCFARVSDGPEHVARKHVRKGAEGLGPLAGDTITAIFGFPGIATATFGTHRARHGAGARFGLTLYGTRGVLSMGTGTLPPMRILEDPSWNLSTSARWQPVTSAGIGQPEPLPDGSHRAGNVLIARDLLRCIESGDQPRANVVDGRAALEMVMAVYESHRRNGPVNLPLMERRNPLELLP